MSGDTNAMAILVAGFFLGISLIMAVGPQNILIIKQGIKREAVTLVILICLFSDLVLFVLGVLSVGKISQLAPQALIVVKWLGAIYLWWFAYSAARDALNPRGITIIEDKAPASAPSSPSSSTSTTAVITRATTRPLLKPALSAIALTWLNPGAYVDTFVMIGGIANQYGETLRWVFAAGAFMASLVWFPLLGYGARALSNPLSRPEVWRVLNWIIAGVLVLISVKMILS